MEEIRRLQKSLCEACARLVKGILFKIQRLGQMFTITEKVDK